MPVLPVALRRRLPSRRLIKIYFCCFLAQFGIAFSMTMLYPFLPFMTEFLVPDVSETEIALFCYWLLIVGGRYVGLIASAVFAGRTFGCFLWGAMADSIGRKPVIVVFSILVGLFSASFGFSVNIAMAFFTRFFVGFFDGITGTVKAIIAESSVTSNQQALGLSVVATSWGVGLIAGPAVGGALSDPINQFNLNISSPAIERLFTLFPYCLPGIVNMLLCGVSVVCSLCLLPETLHKKTQKFVVNTSTGRALPESAASRDTPGVHLETTDLDNQPLVSDCGDTCDDDNESLTSCVQNLTSRTCASPQSNGLVSEQQSLPPSVGECVCEQHRDRTIVEEGDSEGLSNYEVQEQMCAVSVATDDQLLIEAAPVISDSHGESVPPSWSQHFQRQRSTPKLVEAILGRLRKLPRKKCLMCQRRAKALARGVKNALVNLRDFLRDRVTRLCLYIFVVYMIAATSFDELYPLWAYTPPNSGGLGLDLHEIGITLAITGAVLLPPLLFAFSLMEKYFGGIRTLQICSIVFMFFAILFPTLHKLSEHKVALRLLVIVFLIITRFTYTVLNAVVAFLVNNSVTADKLGSVNGTAMVAGAVFRIVTPLATGWIFSLSLSDTLHSVGYPLDYHLTFLLVAFLLLCLALLPALLPEGINRKK